MVYQEFIKFLETKKNILILGKGHITNKITKEYDLYIGIKQSIGILPKKDILIMNDFEGIFGIEQFIPEFKYILCPNSIHIEHLPNQEYNFKLYQYLKELGFTGKIINYEIMNDVNKVKTNPELDVINTNNSGDIIFHFLKKKTNIDIYGMYNCLDDNLKITKLIIDRKYTKFKQEYESYLKRVYKNKRGVNLLMIRNNLNVDLSMVKTNRDLKLLMINSQKRILSQYPNLAITFM